MARRPQRQGDPFGHVRLEHVRILGEGDDALGLKPTADIVGYRLRAMGPGPTDDEVIADLRRCGRELKKKRLLFRQYRDWARRQERLGKAANTPPISPNTFIARLGSFAAALRLAGLETALNGPRTRSTENTPERLIGLLRACASEESVDRLTVERYNGWRDRVCAQAERCRQQKPLPITSAAWRRRSGPRA